MDDVRVVGVEDVEFTGDNGLVKGKSVYCLEHIDPRRGQGEKGFKVFLSVTKLATLGYSPSPGQLVHLAYDRRGRIDGVTVVDEVLDIS